MGRRRQHRATYDGFVNFSARLGLGTDNLLARSAYRTGQYVTRNRARLDDMYRSSWVVGRAVEVVAEDMCRSGIDIQGGLPSDEISALLKAYRSTGIPGRLSDAIKWGRLYGGALAVILIDGHGLDTPLEMDAIGEGTCRGAGTRGNDLQAGHGLPPLCRSHTGVCGFMGRAL
jgi:hypothetical protein